jgi:hypothetical protein
MLIRFAVVPLILGAALLSGCESETESGPEPTPGPSENGISAMPGNAILERALVALEGAKSYRLAGTVPVDEKAMQLDLKINGDDVGGFVTLEGARVNLLAVAGKRYMRPDAAFWKQNFDADAAATMAKLLGDKWVLVPEGDKDFGSIFQVTRFETVLDSKATMTKGTPKDVDGVPAIPLTEEGGDGTAVYITTVGEPYPVLIEPPDPADGRLTISDFGATFDDIVAPPEAQVVDLDSLRRN